jgi:hypothetical protein
MSCFWIFDVHKCWPMRRGHEMNVGARCPNRSCSALSTMIAWTICVAPQCREGPRSGRFAIIVILELIATPPAWTKRTGVPGRDRNFFPMQLVPAPGAAHKNQAPTFD